LAGAAIITEFQLAMAWETEQLRLDPLKCTPGVRAVFEQPQRGRYYVATEGDRILGSLLITYEWSDWRNGDIWWIQSVYVIPEARNDVYGLRLYVEKHNTRAKQVYQQLGMSGDHYEVCEWMKG
jgi:GNAT superfamily N-acetyltransferase